MPLKEAIDHLRPWYEQLCSERSDALSRVAEMPIENEAAYRRRGYEYAAIRRRYDPMIFIIQNRLVEAQAASTRDGVIYVQPIEDDHHYRQLLNAALSR